jgi:hypothetical protein
MKRRLPRCSVIRAPLSCDARHLHAADFLQSLTRCGRQIDFNDAGFVILCCRGSRSCPDARRPSAP